MLQTKSRLAIWSMTPSKHDGQLLRMLPCKDRLIVDNQKIQPKAFCQAHAYLLEITDLVAIDQEHLQGTGSERKDGLLRLIRIHREFGIVSPWDD